MILAFTSGAWNDYLYWRDNDLEVLDKINELIKEIIREPFKGKGKPEPLRGNLAGFWSRRITDAHRLVYRISGTGDTKTITIIQARFHY